MRSVPVVVVVVVVVVAVVVVVVVVGWLHARGVGVGDVFTFLAAEPVGVLP